MGRPFLLIGSAVLFASFMLATVSLANVCITLFIFGILLTLWVIKFQKSIYKGVVIALIFLLVVLRIGMLVTELEANQTRLLGTTAEIKGRVTNVSFDNQNYTVYTVKVEEGVEEIRGKLLKTANYNHVNVSAGDRICATVEFNNYPVKYKLTNYSQGHYYLCDVKNVTVLKRGTNTLWKIAEKLRYRISQAISIGGENEETALLSALVIGKTDKISPVFMQNVKYAGVSHMLVVSGMHLGIVCGALMNLLNRRIGRVASAVTLIMAVSFITVVCLFHTSILRAGIAYFVMLIGRIIFKNPDSLSSLGFGVVVAVMITPYIFYNVAFLLSVAATYAVIYPAKMLMDIVNFEKLGKWGISLKYAYDILIISICALFCTLPIVSSYFGYVATASPLSNLAVTFAVNIALILGVLATAIYFVPMGSIICLPIFFAARIFISYFKWIINMIGESRIGLITVSADKNIYCFFISVSFILLVKASCVFIMKRKEKALNAQREDP